MTIDAKTRSSVKASADDARFYWLDEGRTAGGFIREIDHSLYDGVTSPLFDGIKIVDCDTHFTEPPDLFQRDAPPSMRAKLPRVVRVNGADRWFIGEKDFGSIGGNVIRKDRNKLLGKLAFTTYDEIHPGSYLVKPRLQEMDKMGIWAQICFQNGGLTQGGSLVALNDEDLAMTVIRGFNDACAERMHESDGRINCMATLQIMVFHGAHLIELVFQHFKHKWHPADAAFNEANLQILILVQDAGHHEIAHGGGNPESMQHGGDRQLLRELEIVPHGRSRIE